MNEDEETPASGQPRHPDTGAIGSAAPRVAMGVGRIVAIAVAVLLAAVIVVLHLTGVIGAGSH